LVATVSGRISGAASLIRESAQNNLVSDPTAESILNHTNSANDYTLGTIIRSGILRIPNDAVLGAAGAPITFDIDNFSEGPPALVTTTDCEIARPITLADTGSLRAEPATTARYTSEITGPAGLDIGFNIWTGAVALEAANTYAGPTRVRAGTLIAANTTGSATGTGAVTVESGATLAGDGVIAGAVTVNAGATLSPGESAGVLTIGGLALNPAASVRIELGGLAPGESDRITITGPSNVALDGDLTLEFLPGYTPTNGDEFIILSATSVTGAFATESLPDGVQIEYTPTQVIARAVAVSQPCPTDFNADGATNGADLGQLHGSWGPRAGPTDLTNDGATN
ncbi:MAG: hypothetical protein VYC34_05290, partial [Planctomycetota bacterium]|nr:hypothetical protein [Planctomycetota bacterium]